MSIMPKDFRAIEAKMPATEPWRVELLKAAERIAVRGHAKHTLVNSAGANCAIGAIRNYRPYKDMFSASNFFVESDLAIWHLSKKVGSIPEWNNAPDRTAEEVIDTMIEVALAP